MFAYLKQGVLQVQRSYAGWHVVFLWETGNVEWLLPRVNQFITTICVRQLFYVVTKIEWSVFGDVEDTGWRSTNDEDHVSSFF